jgi:hypothetical protein
MDPEAAPAAGPDAPERSTARPGGAPRAPRPTVAGHPGRAGTGPGSAGPAGSDGGPAPDAGARPTSGAGAGARAGDDREAERGLRGLVGSGSSQVSVNAALRARDAARPTDEQLAEAEEHLVIVRRNWLPREDLPRR